MSTPGPTPPDDPDDRPLHLHILSRNQKRRSRLNQPHDPAPPPEPEPPKEPEPAPEPPVAPRRLRFKRSGHMHQELIPPDETPRPESEY